MAERGTAGPRDPFCLPWPHSTELLGGSSHSSPTFNRVGITGYRTPSSLDNLLLQSHQILGECRSLNREVRQAQGTNMTFHKTIWLGWKKDKFGVHRYLFWSERMNKDLSKWIPVYFTCFHKLRNLKEKCDFPVAKES